jgi:LEA14-like dessication related protein
MSVPIISIFGAHRRALALVVLVGALLGGAVVTGVLGAPSVGAVENRFGPVNESSTVVETDLVVSNPNPVGVSLGDVRVEYGVQMNDVTIASGAKDGVAVDPGNSTLQFETAMRNERIPEWWHSHVEHDERTTVTVDAAAHSSTLGRTFEAPSVTRDVETDLLSQFNSTETREVNADRPVVSDPVLYVNETSAHWGDPNESATPIHLRFVVYNPKPYPVAVSELGYDVSMNDVGVGDGRTSSAYVVSPGSTETVETTAYVRNERLDEWWVSHLERNQVSDLRIDFSARLSLSEETVRVPLDALTYEKTVETDIFGTKPDGESPETSEATADSTETATGGETPTDSTETADDRTATQTDDSGLFGDSTDTDAGSTSETSTAAPTAGETTSAPTSTGTATAAETAGATTTDDGGLLG